MFLGNRLLVVFSFDTAKRKHVHDTHSLQRGVSEDMKIVVQIVGVDNVVYSAEETVVNNI